MHDLLLMFQKYIRQNLLSNNNKFDDIGDYIYSLPVSIPCVYVTFMVVVKEWHEMKYKSAQWYLYQFFLLDIDTKYLCFESTHNKIEIHKHIIQSTKLLQNINTLNEFVFDQFLEN